MRKMRKRREIMRKKIWRAKIIRKYIAPAHMRIEIAILRGQIYDYDVIIKSKFSLVS